MCVCMYVHMFGWNKGLIDENDNDADYVTYMGDDSGNVVGNERNIFSDTSLYSARVCED